MSNTVAHNFADFMRDNATPAERVLREILNQLGVEYIEQYVVEWSKGRHFIVDFYLVEYGLGIEVDGLFHLFKDQAEYDKVRTAILSEHGITIKRILNSYILGEPHNVKKDIKWIINDIQQMKLGN